MAHRGWFTYFVKPLLMTAPAYALAWSWLFAEMTGVAFSHVLLGGALYGIVMGTFNAGAIAYCMRAVTMTIPAGPDREAFAARVVRLLAELSYHPALIVPDSYTFCSARFSGLRGKVTVTVGGTEASITGPWLRIRQLRSRISGLKPA